MFSRNKYANGLYSLKNPQKYSGNKNPRYRSAWEHAFMRFCDNHPSVVNWASEAVQIPYRNPLLHCSISNKRKENCRIS